MTIDDVLAELEAMLPAPAPGSVGQQLAELVERIKAALANQPPAAPPAA